MIEIIAGAVLGLTLRYGFDFPTWLCILDAFALILIYFFLTTRVYFIEVDKENSDE